MEVSDVEQLEEHIEASPDAGSALIDLVIISGFSGANASLD